MTYGEMKLEYENMKSEYKELQSLYEKMELAYDDMKIKYENMALQLNVLNKMQFGFKRELTPIEVNKEQCSLFDTATKPTIDETIYEEIIEKTKEITVRKKEKREKAGIRESYLKNVELVIEEYKLNEDEKCPECDSKLKEVSKEVVRQEIEYVPAKLKIINYVQYTYKCEKCGTKESDNVSAKFVKTKLPSPLLTHSFVSASLATEIIYQKYCMGSPLYRQEKYWYDKGLVLPRNMMANWCIKLSEYYFTNIYNLMFKIMKHENELEHCDETTMQCNKEVGRKSSSNSYMWVMRSGELEKVKGVIFSYSQTRN